MSRVVGLAIVFAQVFCAAHCFEWSLCGEGVVAVSNVELSPDPAVTGQEVQFRILGDSGEVVSGGTLVSEVYYLGFRVYRQSGDLCDGGNTCPTQPGQAEFKFVKNFPRLAPTGSYSIRLHARDNDRDVFCVDLRFQLVRAGNLVDGFMLTANRSVA